MNNPGNQSHLETGDIEKTESYEEMKSRQERERIEVVKRAQDDIIEATLEFKAKVRGALNDASGLADLIINSSTELPCIDQNNRIHRKIATNRDFFIDLRIRLNKLANIVESIKVYQ